MRLKGILSECLAVFFFGDIDDKEKRPTNFTTDIKPLYRTQEPKHRPSYATSQPQYKARRTKSRPYYRKVQSQVSHISELIYNNLHGRFFRLVDVTGGCTVVLIIGSWQVRDKLGIHWDIFNYFSSPQLGPRLQLLNPRSLFYIWGFQSSQSLDHLRLQSNCVNSYLSSWLYTSDFFPS